MSWLLQAAPSYRVKGEFIFKDVFFPFDIFDLFPCQMPQLDKGDRHTVLIFQC